MASEQWLEVSCVLSYVCGFGIKNGKVPWTHIFSPNSLLRGSSAHMQGFEGGAPPSAPGAAVSPSLCGPGAVSALLSLRLQLLEID